VAVAAAIAGFSRRNNFIAFTAIMRMVPTTSNDCMDEQHHRHQI